RPGAKVRALKDQAVPGIPDLLDVGIARGFLAVALHRRKLSSQESLRPARARTPVSTYSAGSWEQVRECLAIAALGGTGKRGAGGEEQGGRPGGQHGGRPAPEGFLLAGGQQRRDVQWEAQDAGERRGRIERRQRLTRPV